MKNMNIMNEMETREANGGKTYVCPFCYGVSGSYVKVYAHALAGCFKKNPYLKALWNAGWTLIDIGKKIGGIM